jgi:type VI secretion system protein
MDEGESIRLHLLRMLTARQGSVQALPDYGLPDINDLTLSRAELLQITCQAIKQCVERCEPRLTAVEVHHLPLEDMQSAFTMGFHIKALILDAEGGLTPWQWNLSLDRDNVRDRS